jgi:hypothetical protein
MDSLASLTSLQRVALKILREAAQTADRLGQDIWQFAIEIDRFHAVGVSNTDLRRLLCLGHIEHCQERTTDGAKQRSFEKLDNLELPQRTCFVVTAQASDVASEESPAKRMAMTLTGADPSEARGSLSEVPWWDGKARQLWWHGLLTKQLHRPARNQETVLAAFEEEGWPMRIDDPLPQTPEIDPKVRLHDTIKNLNRHQLRRGICFRGDGRGWGVLWMVQEPD